MFTLTEVAVSFGSSVVAVAMYIGAHRAGIISFLKKEAPAAAGVVEAGLHAVEEVAQLPLAKTIEAELRHKLNAEQATSQELTIRGLAAAGLNAFEADLKGLSDDQKKALIFEVAKLLPAEWNVSKDTIQKALDEAQKLSDAIAATKSVLLANQFTEELKSSPAAPAEQAQTPA